MIRNVTLKVSNIHSCKQCIQAVDNTIKELPGIVSTVIKKGAARIHLDISYESSTVSFEKIRDAIINLGYPISGYIIHEHSHTHGGISHTHFHGHEEKGNGHNENHNH